MDPSTYYFYAQQQQQQQQNQQQQTPFYHSSLIPQNAPHPSLAQQQQPLYGTIPMQQQQPQQHFITPNYGVTPQPPQPQRFAYPTSVQAPPSSLPPQNYSTAVASPYVAPANSYNNSRTTSTPSTSSSNNYYSSNRNYSPYAKNSSSNPYSNNTASSTPKQSYSSYNNNSSTSSYGGSSGNSSSNSSYHDNKYGSNSTYSSSNNSGGNRSSRRYERYSGSKSYDYYKSGASGGNNSYYNSSSNASSRSGSHAQTVTPSDTVPASSTVDTKKQSSIKEVDSQKATKEKYEIFNLSNFPYFHEERYFLDLQNRYPNLYMASDFTKAVYFWKKNIIEVGKTYDVITKSNIHFHCDNSTGNLMEKFPRLEATMYKGCKHNAKVLLLSGATQQSLFSTHEEQLTHLCSKLSFLLGKKEKTGYLLLGGSWNSQKDSGDPLEDSVMIKTAIRNVKEMNGMDLSQCDEWIKFAEVFYHRPSEIVSGTNYPEMDERTVVFIPNIWKLVETPELQKSVFEMREEVLKKLASTDGDEDFPTVPTLYSVSQKQQLAIGITTASVTLEQLLNYKIEEYHEKHFEVSLIAEGFKEMLQYKFAALILECLDKEKKLRESDSKLFSREENQDEISLKRQKLNSEVFSEVKISLEHKDDIPVELEYWNAFKFFDKVICMYLKLEDVETLIQALNFGISRKHLSSLLLKCSDATTKVMDYSKFKIFESIVSKKEQVNTSTEIMLDVIDSKLEEAENDLLIAETMELQQESQEAVKQEDQTDAVN